ncbi:MULTISPECIES: SusC/RagA family TonB-linked outer membrane protein [Proteiniphilum]|uniref:SusC/RagA family TonB-linked outer membrane protein n=1 Tax=Proteiniphilum TaxID=294702 RepID=UPI001EEB2528|nr:MULTISPECIES: TonB-dependent receptor [Proteiniphilum]ULB34191.1 TonB-dependent receptor [Proteiniphilum propionicum]
MKRLCNYLSGVVMILLIVSMTIPNNLLAENMEQFQSGRIEGIVMDELGEPMTGVTVRVKNMNLGTVTDVKGHYSINANENATLVFSFVGYRTQEILVRNRSIINVIMQEDTQLLEEMVVIGYGSVRKRDLTGAVSSLAGDALLKTNPVSVNQGLQGKLAGVNVSQADGAPGAGINIQIRGANSFTTSTEPLYIIDGMPFSVGEAPATDYGTKQKNNPLSMISPQDIQSIEVLKDASATAIYGSRAANGVVIITTKSGKEGKARVQFSSNLSISNPVKTIDVLSAAEYAEFRNELVTNGYMYDGKEYVDPSQLPYPLPGRWSETIEKDPETGEEVVVKREYLPSPDDFRTGFLLNDQMFYGTNWQDEIFHTAISKEYNLTVSGGDKNGSYMYSGGYLDNQGVIVNSYYKRYSVRANNTRKVNDLLEIGANISFTSSDNRLARTNSENYGVIASAISFNPTRPVFDPSKDSGFSEDFSSGLANPYLTVHTEKNLLESVSAFTSGFGELTFTDWLKFRQNFGYSYSFNERNQYYNRWTGSGQYPTNGYGVKSDNAYESLTTESLLNYDKKFGIHAVNAVLGLTYEKVMWKNKSMNAKNFPSDDTEDNDINAAIGAKEISSGKGQSQLMSYLFRTNYNLMDRYLLTFSMRRDGSSRLSSLNRWNNFYSGAIAWRLSDEELIKSLNFFDNLKLRFSAGQTGNQGVNAYATRSRFVSSNYPFDGTFTSGMAEDRWGGPAAPDLKWETTIQYDLGLDAAFFNNRVNLVFDVYYKKTSDLLQYKLIPMSSGFAEIASNYGSVINKGLEISGNFIPVKTKDFIWRFDANISFNKNRVEGLNADQFSDVAWGIESMFLRRNGYPIGTLYGYVEDGFYDNEAEVRADRYYTNESASKVKSMVGQVKYKNMDDDPVIDDRDKTIIGNTNPDYQYGITNTLIYKDFTFSFFLQGTHGNDILNVNLKSFEMAGSNNMPKFVWDNRWTADNRANALWPRSDGTYTRSMKPSDRYVVDGSYLRCKNVSLSYRWTPPFKYIESINFVSSVTNLFTISSYDWYDPDVNTFGSDASRRGVDLASYPSARTFNFGIQLAF